jgi:quercetin dioxygenase-like cupin family protein
MNATVVRLASATLLVFAVQLGRAEGPTSPAAATLEKPIMVAPTDIEWGECPPFLPPGAKCTTIEGDPQAPNALFTIRSKLPDNYKIPPHFHPTDEHVTVISGTCNMGLGKNFDEKALRPIVAGSFMVMPKGVPHFALTRGETIVQVHAIGPLVFTYIHPEDDPGKR